MSTRPALKSSTNSSPRPFTTESAKAKGSAVRAPARFPHSECHIRTTPASRRIARSPLPARFIAARDNLGRGGEGSRRRAFAAGARRSARGRACGRRLRRQGSGWPGPWRRRFAPPAVSRPASAPGPRALASAPSANSRPAARGPWRRARSRRRLRPPLSARAPQEAGAGSPPRRRQ